MIVPDTTGFTLRDAKLVLSEIGIRRIDVITTAPPKHQGLESDDNCRVVRQKNFDSKERIELTVCRTDW